MGIWEDRLLPRLIDKLGANPEVARLRARACAGLHGVVLEIGFAGGQNLPHYPASVTSVLAVEPSDAGWALSEKRREESALTVLRSGLDGQRLTEPDDSVDCVLSTLTLCTIPDVEAALAEAHRVLRPGGSLHFLEHGLAPDPGVVTWQHRLDPLQGAVFGGCHLARDIPGLVRGAGFTIDEIDASYLPGPGAMRPWSYAYLGRAAA